MGAIRKSDEPRKARAIGQILVDVLGHLERSDLRKCGIVFLHWKDMVGDSLALHTQPVSIRGKKLKVAVDSSSWLYEIRTSFEKMILEKVQSYAGPDVIQEIMYQVGDMNKISYSGLEQGNDKSLREV